jgi:hypothetical protein
MEFKEIDFENGGRVELSPDHDELQALVSGVLLAQYRFYPFTEWIIVKLAAVMVVSCGMSRKEAANIL